MEPLVVEESLRVKRKGGFIRRSQQWVNVLSNPDLDIGLEKEAPKPGTGVHRRIAMNAPSPDKKPTNEIHTTKYNVLTFLPRNLYEQFHRWAYIYFLVLIILNQLPFLAVFGRFASMIPLLLVLVLQMFKDGYEDWRRRREDRRVNECVTHVLENGQYVDIPWKQIRPGYQILVKRDEEIPTDVIVLRTSDPDGVCFVETAQLDGESNLKARNALTATMLSLTSSASASPEEAAEGVVECEQPTKNIYEFSGLLELSEGRQYALGIKNMLLRGCVLRSTDWAVGIAVYVGHETKVLLNTTGARSKRSKMERGINRDMLYLMAILFAMCLVDAIGTAVFLDNGNYNVRWFLAGTGTANASVPEEAVVAFLTSLLLFQVMVPIALYIIMEAVKLGQIFRMEADLSMFDAETGQHLICRALNINEDLGQIDIIFSDKTGTLTQNKMVYNACSIGGREFWASLLEDGVIPGSYFPVSALQALHSTTSGTRTPVLLASGSRTPVLPASGSRTPITSASGSRTPPLAYASGNKTPPLISLSGNKTPPLTSVSGNKTPPLNSKPGNRTPPQTAANGTDFSFFTLSGDDADRANSGVAEKVNSSAQTAVSPQLFEDFFTVLALCNTAVPTPYEQDTNGVSDPTEAEDGLAEMEPMQDGVVLTPTKLEDANPPTQPGVRYQSESPDEVALVVGAANQGFRLLERSSNWILLEVFGQLRRYEILGTHEFDSARRLMSIVVRFPDGSTRLLAKGADTSIFGRLRGAKQDADDLLAQLVTFPGDDEEKRFVATTQAHLDAFASRGLRTLVVAQRKLTPAEVQSWQEDYMAASVAIDNREAQMHKVSHSIERNFDLLGATAIEDQLQVGVPETIAALRDAGISIWMLTGDKQETAIAIGQSSALLTDSMKQITVNATSLEECQEQIQSALETYGLQVKRPSKAPPRWSPSTPAGSVDGDENEGQSLALIINGLSLAFALEDDALGKSLYQLSSACAVVICCRVAPLQKAGVVDLVKKNSKAVTLSVGDGANDVAMIQSAHVGIGISGQEGRQAVMASDFAIGQFRFLLPLLLAHGHWNYYRLGIMVLYNYYKNAVFVFMLFWFNVYAAFSSQSPIDQYNLLFYSLFYTTVPSIIYGVHERDLTAKTLLSEPRLYQQGQQDKIYNQTMFWIWLLDSVYQSLVLWFVPYGIYHLSYDAGLWTVGMPMLFAVVIVANLQLAMDTLFWTRLLTVSFCFSVLICLALTFFLYEVPIPFLEVTPQFGVPVHVFGTANFYLSVLLSVVMCLLPRFVVKELNNRFNPAPRVVLREAEILKSKVEAATESRHALNDSSINEQALPS